MVFCSRPGGRGGYEGSGGRDQRAAQIQLSAGERDVAAQGADLQHGEQDEPAGAREPGKGSFTPQRAR